jgi:hypothetical protein
MRQKARAFSVWLTLALAVLTMSVSARPASAQSTDLINYTNSYAVANGPQYPTRFTLSAPAAITQLITYHWNFGRGARPGFISLQHQSGQTFGPFAAIGTSGQNGAPNVNWIANVNITLPAGTYTVLDSDPSTWSHNAQSGFQGFFILRGTLLTATDLINYTNGYSVANGPQYPTRFTLSAPAAVTQMQTYHWNFGRGARPGTIGLGLLNQNGQVIQTFGPFAAIGTSGQNGAPNVNWIANVNITLPAGTYTVLDSDPSTWSHNAQSGFQGFFILRGTLLPPGLFPPFDTAGGNFQTARNLGVLSPGFPIQVNEWVGQTSSFWDTADFYSFTVPATGLTANPRNVTITTTGIGGDLSLFLYSLQPLTQLGYSFNLNSNNETIQVALYPGTYYVWVSPSTFGGPTAYTLRINT